jgi:hypothetical protein
LCEKPVVSISKNIVCSLQRELFIKLSAVLLVLLSLLCISFRLNVLVIVFINYKSFDYKKYTLKKCQFLFIIYEYIHKKK